MCRRRLNVGAFCNECDQIIFDNRWLVGISMILRLLTSFSGIRERPSIVFFHSFVAFALHADVKSNATKLSYKSLHKNDFRSVGVSVGVAVAVVVARKRRRKISLTPTLTNTATTTGHVYVYGKYVMPMIYTFS